MSNMINCDVQVVNGTNLQGVYNVSYLPFGVSTLKFRLINHEDLPVKVTLCPKQFSNSNDFCGGYDDDKAGIKVSWGGGLEDGAILSVPSGNDNSRNAFLVVHHDTKTIQPSYNLTLQVRKSIGYAKKKTEEQEFLINLRPIEEISDEIVRKNPEGNERLSFVGKNIGLYYPRWFPEEISTFSQRSGEDHYSYYKKARDILAINLLFERKIDEYDNDRVLVKLGNDNGINIATIVGDMDGSTFHSDLFQFDDSTFVLRLWFFWLSKNQYTKRENLKIIERDVERGISTPEIPDSERFDLFITKSGKLLCIGTDFHWQEYWYRLKEGQSAMDGFIAKYMHPVDRLGSRLFKRIFNKMNEKELSEIIRTLQGISQDGLEQVPIQPESDGQAFESNLKEESTDLERSLNTGRERGSNLMRSHVPYVKNGYIIPNMVSKDVRNVASKEVSSSD